MTSHWIGLLQARGILVSEHVVLCLPSAGRVVTYFVTGSKTIFLVNAVSSVLAN
jgi:hypothetical protein